MASTVRRTTNGFVKSLSELTVNDVNPSYASSTQLTSESDSSILGISWQMWIIMILVLALLGINIFSYISTTLQTAGEVTKSVTDYFAPILKMFGYQSLETTKQIVDVSSEGTKKTADIVSNTTTDAINKVQEETNLKHKPKRVKESQEENYNTTVPPPPVGNELSKYLTANAVAIDQINEMEDDHEDSLNNALADASRSSSNIQPDNAHSSIQNGGKSGWCFVGKDRGNRICSSISPNDECLSGEIFPSQQICMNPNLRP